MSTLQASESIKLINYGGYENIVTEMVPTVSLQKEQLKIKVKACGVNFCDTLIWQGIYELNNQALPLTMGIECAGIVEEVGENIQDFQKGDRVMCWSYFGGMWTESICLPATNCIKIPADMTYKEAASFPINYLTAYLAVMEFGHLKPGQVILLQMAAGGVGCAVSQLAKTVENVTIIGMASSGKHEAVLKNGVSHCFDYDCNIVTEVQKLYPKGVDIIISTFLGSEVNSLRQLLKPMGRFIFIGAANVLQGERRSIFHLIKLWWQTKYINPTELISKNHSVCGLNISNLFEIDPEYFKTTLGKILRLFESGKLKPIIHSTFPFSEVRKAFECIIQRKNIGKLILIPSKDFSIDA
ncbi:synaptic vesicle membrane protein VAT-1 homolog [Centruroides vittatus]|uniref:synaptic vesicle membrane protein VAT-1 homolog n=1 Tax=Centruroides vittatus TaxID=120091 RepID=UPI00350FA00B